MVLSYFASFNVLHSSTNPDQEYLTQPESLTHSEPQYITLPESRPVVNFVPQTHFNTEKATVKPFIIEPQHGASSGISEKVTCGIPVLGLAQSLVIGGKAASRGQWPWYKDRKFK